MPTLRYVIVDVFTDRALAGNQLAVFTDDRGIDTETMQALALEIGFSETTYVLPAEGDGDVRLRIFTPKVELPLAGRVGSRVRSRWTASEGDDPARNRAGLCPSSSIEMSPQPSSSGA